MFTGQKRLIIPGASVLVIGLAIGSAYVFDFPPFESSVGKIRAAQLCDSFGAKKKAASSLKSVLPHESEYSFKETPGTRVGSDGSSYTSDCFVWGDDKILLSVRTEMMRAEPPEGWIKSEVMDAPGNRRELKVFRAGDEGVASSSTAGVFVPCVSAGQIPGGKYNLSVIVKLKQKGDSSGDDARGALRELAVGAAEFAHRDARCDLLAKLPGDA
ncbi:hypothetical protein ACFWZT_11170 [Streptomyces alboflavus]|uniref:hypothetical protein n=1 Tax=Streptomyces alboflavus TaxID=67267 RepID=UPI0036A2D15E